MSSCSKSTVVVGDCGGTNTRLSIWSFEPNAALPKRGSKAPGTLVFEKSYENEGFGTIVEILKLFLKESGVAEIPAVSCLACAGPIINNTVAFTNQHDGWKIDGFALQEQVGISSVRLVNDFTAMGYGLLTLDPSECLVLNDAPVVEGGVVATIGAGTGLGETFLTMDPTTKTYTCWASEGGHCDWAPHTELELDLLNFAREKYAHKNRVSVERIISGPGISMIYEFLSTVKYPEKVDASVHKEWEGAGAQKGGVVAKNAKNCELCKNAMDIFFHAYASEAGNAMLKWLPTGGFYLTGGINVKNMEYYEDGEFLKVALDKGRVSPAIKKCPIYVSKADDVGERGAVLVAFQMMKKDCA